jgi:DNA/RNA endonuclease YhcR with UshA esterase domain
MLLKKSLMALAIVALMAPMASAQITLINDIQLYTAAGAPNSPLAGTTVTVHGIITCVAGTYNGGTHYIEDATGGIQFFDSGAPALSLGDEVEVTGSVSAFGGEIQISPTSYNFIGASTPLTGLALTPSEAVDNDGSGTQTYQDYEIVGRLIAVTGNIAFLPGVEAPPWTTGTGQGTVGLTDASGDTLIVFVDRTTGIDASAMQDGDLFQVTGPLSVYNGLLELKPRMQSDLVENPGNPFPLVQNITPNPWAPELNEAVTVSADISDNGTITRAELFYRDRGGSSFSTVTMVDDGFGNYSATIPGTSAAGLDYYVEAEDETAQVTSVPGDAPTSFLQVAVGTTSIVDIQSDITPPSDASNKLGALLNIEALVTVAPGEIGSNSNYVVGEAEGGKWSGILVYEGSASNIFLRGDRIRISGTVGEYSGTTEFLPQNGDAIELVSFGNPMPPIPVMDTTRLDTTEAWESVIVATPRAAVADTVYAGAEWMLQSSGADSTIYVDPAVGVSHVATLGEEMYVTGWLDTRFGRNEVVPRDDNDIILATAVANDPAPVALGAHFDDIAPNPFNPSTKISFTTPKAGLTELVIFDTRGRAVRTLVSGRLDGGAHTEKWDGRDNAGEFVGSGVYYARLRFETKSLSVEKLTLVK